ncbi:gamma-glutamylcyclotransferase family protein [Shimia sp.]|uniref:gamma-glutamylcyclotransferase family protein n=1 Tax=Shimia sp. TaxID=1954381 RepID=UPI00329788D4
MKAPYFFGYGSLVNRDTHQYGDTHPARLTGWRRVWRHTDLRALAYLTIEPDPHCEIEGLIAHVPDGDWAALDERERAYDRIDANHAVSHPKPAAIDVATYTVPKGKHGAPDTEHPVLLSYVDTVVQGYLREFGEAGVARFFATTHGWSAPMLNDRAAPRYPRYEPVSEAAIDLVDEGLHQQQATLIT